MQILNINMAEEDIEWNIPYSDDEDDSCKTEKTIEGEENWEIPLNVLLLYSEIEKNGFIELKVKSCQSTASATAASNLANSCVEKKEDIQEPTNVEFKKAEPESSGNEETFANNEKDKAPEPSAFDYTEESIDDSSLLTRKTPKTERFQRKRVGTLENVISDLKRFRDMDNKEGESDDQKNVKPEDDGDKNGQT